MDNNSKQQCDIPSHHLSSEERAKAGIAADEALRLIGERYGMHITELIEAARWVQEHRQFVAKLKTASLLTLMGILISAAVMSMWEGLKAYVRMGGK